MDARDEPEAPEDHNVLVDMDEAEVLDEPAAMDDVAAAMDDAAGTTTR